MTASQSIVPLLIGEKPIVPDTSNFNEVFNPSKAEVIALRPMCGPKEVDIAVQVAAKAYRDWSITPSAKRSAIIFRFKQLLEQELESLSRLITLENGKTYAEAKRDVRRGIEVVDFACGIAQLTKGENLSRISMFKELRVLCLILVRRRFSPVGILPTSERKAGKGLALIASSKNRVKRNLGARNVARL
jgi:acyl-CoA reductase-like NAD-dependent aldehyde dehydrogenase